MFLFPSLQNYNTSDPIDLIRRFSEMMKAHIAQKEAEANMTMTDEMKPETRGQEGDEAEDSLYYTGDYEYYEEEGGYIIPIQNSSTTPPTLPTPMPTPPTSTSTTPRTTPPTTQPTQITTQIPASTTSHTSDTNSLSSDSHLSNSTFHSSSSADDHDNDQGTTNTDLIAYISGFFSCLFLFLVAAFVMKVRDDCNNCAIGTQALLRMREMLAATLCPNRWNRQEDEDDLEMQHIVSYNSVDETASIQSPNQQALKAKGVAEAEATYPEKYHDALEDQEGDKPTNAPKTTSATTTSTTTTSTTVASTTASTISSTTASTKPSPSPPTTAESQEGSGGEKRKRSVEDLRVAAADLNKSSDMFWKEDEKEKKK